MHKVLSCYFVLDALHGSAKGGFDPFGFLEIKPSNDGANKHPYGPGVHGWLTTSLLKSSYRAFTHLRKGWAKDTPYSAWTCRNLLELRIITKHVIQYLLNVGGLSLKCTIRSGRSCAPR